jgi:hypothetical protein
MTDRIVEAIRYQQVFRRRGYPAETLNNSTRYDRPLEFIAVGTSLKRGIGDL